MERDQVDRKDGLKTIYCADGPFAHKIISGIVVKRKIAVPMPNNPFYESAVYFVTGGKNAWSETIAVFSHCRRRN